MNEDFPVDELIIKGPSVQNELDRKRGLEIVEDLQGTCDAMEQHATDEECDNQTILHVIDENIFCCAICGWWCEVSEMAEDDESCAQCYQEKEEEDDE